MKNLKIMLAATMLLCATQFSTGVSKPVMSWTNGAYCGYSSLPFYAKINVYNGSATVLEIRNMSGVAVPYTVHSLSIYPDSEGVFAINITVNGVNYTGSIYASTC